MHNPRPNAFTKKNTHDCSTIHTTLKTGRSLQNGCGKPHPTHVRHVTTKPLAGDLGTMVKDDSGPAVSTRKRKAEEEHVQPLGASRSVS